MVVVLDEMNQNFPYPDAVFLDLRSFSCNNEIMKKVLPRTEEASHDQRTTVVRVVAKPFVVSIHGE